ncbi:LysR family transcriptional regulator [Neptunicoccus cionae]|uniref:LysR family transcriptional regulator n=1 Tax=Neptunicoccus cionae TaxID=2035344 RepID=A0A916QVG5_9RHOB|nr:LysR family transcriptional regulator [Amylibacter cionae]GGA14764.1 LysR family transcriptional regulator [Amylibacter cionae]
MLYLTLRQYEYVVAVSKAGSMSAAAQMLNISQPALSVAVATVETHLGRPLFIRRKGAPIRPTGFAKGFLVEAEALLASAAQLENPRADFNKPPKKLRIGCFSDLAPVWLAPSLKRLRAEFEGIELLPLVADFETLAADMAEGQLDLAITYDLGLDARFTRHRLSAVAPGAFVAADDPLAQLPSVALRQLATRDLILFDEGLSVRHMLALFAEVGVRPRVAHRVASLEVMRSFAANGEGVGISYTAPLSDHSYDGLPLQRVEISDPSAQENIVAANRSDMADVLELPRLLKTLAPQTGRDCDPEGQ